MTLSNWIRRLTYQPLLVNASRILRVNRFIRDIYCRVFFPKSKKIELSFGDFKAQFYVDTPVELRIVEAPLEKGMGESDVLEKLLRAARSGEVIYDIGASLGTHTIFMAKKVGENGRVIAFEPEAKSYERLKTNIEINDLKNVIAMNIALGDSLSEGFLYGYGGGYGSFNLMRQGKDISTEKVKIVPGDILVENKRFPFPNLVKIDVEGYEYAVIRGLQKTLRDETCRMVCCEIHPAMLPKEITSDDVINLLKSYGFNRIETYPRGVTFHVFCYKD